MPNSIPLNGEAVPVFRVATDGTPAPSLGQSDPGYVADAQLTGKGDIQATVSTVVTLAAAAGGSIPAGATSVLIQPEGGDIRVARLGTPTGASGGIRVYDGGSIGLTGGLSTVSLVAVSGAVLVNLEFRG